MAKNYLDEKELDALNKIVMAYLDIAEVHALNQEPMYMKDWLETIDDYLRMTRRDILTTKQEYILSPVECHFLESIGELDKLDGKNN
ncbi:hypothetical protein HMPREF9469_04811 [ [[Clostridium] citroniae WAL-17108]|uniref:Uncharacterized protein n=1 Tax=[Clostridium] citroniae WAL-17108 TaxID=742733 RepID=G5HQE9_9FIRM|nr:hypothetical protein HMPREF9469_04811 [ [[Clostridium] citroniae WAL-17108]